MQHIMFFVEENLQQFWNFEGGKLGLSRKFTW